MRTLAQLLHTSIQLPGLDIAQTRDITLVSYLSLFSINLYKNHLGRKPSYLVYLGREKLKTPRLLSRTELWKKLHFLKSLKMLILLLWSLTINRPDFLGSCLSSGADLYVCICILTFNYF